MCVSEREFVHFWSGTSSLFLSLFFYYILIASHDCSNSSSSSSIQCTVTERTRRLVTRRRLKDSGGCCTFSQFPFSPLLFFQGSQITSSPSHSLTHSLGSLSPISFLQHVIVKKRGRNFFRCMNEAPGLHFAPGDHLCVRVCERFFFDGHLNPEYRRICNHQGKKEERRR